MMQKRFIIFAMSTQKSVLCSIIYTDYESQQLIKQKHNLLVRFIWKNTERRL